MFVTKMSENSGFCGQFYQSFGAISKVCFDKNSLFRLGSKKKRCTFPGFFHSRTIEFGRRRFFMQAIKLLGDYVTFFPMNVPMMMPKLQ